MEIYDDIIFHLFLKVYSSPTKITSEFFLSWPPFCVIIFSWNTWEISHGRKQLVGMHDCHPLYA